MSPAPTPEFSAAAAHLERAIAAAPAETLAAAVGELERLKALAWPRLMEGNRTGAKASAEESKPPERWITLEEAEKLTGLSPRWFLNRRASLPFVRKISRKVARVNEAGLLRWMANRPK